MIYLLYLKYLYVIPFILRHDINIELERSHLLYVCLFLFYSKFVYDITLNSVILNAFIIYKLIWIGFLYIFLFFSHIQIFSNYSIDPNFFFCKGEKYFFTWSLVRITYEIYKITHGVYFLVVSDEEFHTFYWWFLYKCAAL